MNEEDKLVAGAVNLVLSDIATTVNSVVERLSRGGRLFYVGTGTSGRLGVLDASECPPTFGVSPELIQGVIAGGYEALYRAVEASEDDLEAGARDLTGRGVTGRDAVIGLAASGRTPYTIGAVRYARSLGAFTAAITCAPGSAITTEAEVSIVPVVGPEVIAGSTRLKSGTAQKMVLNMISTASLIRLGYVSGNRMTNVSARNAKLNERALRILMAETGLSESEARALFDAAGNVLPLAITMSKSGADRVHAELALKKADGKIELAVADLLRPNGP
jgi:N-acetylmuramic acid 6-phosphate etherase